MVTARGSPSGIAQTITEMAMIIVSKTSFQSLFSKENSNESGLQSTLVWHAKILAHPQGTHSIISIATLRHIEKKVRPAQRNPTSPIFSAITASFF